MEEIWRNIKELAFVQVSNRGRVRTADRSYTVRRSGGLPFTRRVKGREIAQVVTRYGYAQVVVIHDGASHKFRVHRLVAQAFVPGEFDGAHVDHLDGNKLNNVPENLDWVTKSENTRRAWKMGLNRGQRSRISDLQAHAIKVLYAHNFPPSMIAEWFGVSVSHAYQIGANKTRGDLKLESRQRPHLA